MRDRDIRPPLKGWIRGVFAGESVKFVEEPQTYGSRIDMLALTATMHGYEIKGPLDTLDRVDFQMESYTRCLPSLTFVTATKHVDELSGRLPEWCGVVEIVEGIGVSFTTRRPAGQNPDWCAESLLRMLDPSDIVAWLERRGEAKGFRGKTSFRILVPAVLSRVPVAEVPLIVARHLRLREPLRAEYRAVRRAMA